jgi:hypothetical protein
VNDETKDTNRFIASLSSLQELQHYFRPKGRAARRLMNFYVKNKRSEIHEPGGGGAALCSGFSFTNLQVPLGCDKEGG